MLMLPVHLASGWLVAIAGLAARWPHPPSGSGPSPLPVAPSALASAGLNPEINKSGQNPSLPNLSHANRKLATLARLNARTPQTTGATSNPTRVVQPLSKASPQAKYQDYNSGPLGPSSPDVKAPRSYLNVRPKCALTAGTTNAVSHTTDAVALHATLDESSPSKSQAPKAKPTQWRFAHAGAIQRNFLRNTSRNARRPRSATTHSPPIP